MKSIVTIVLVVLLPLLMVGIATDPLLHAATPNVNAITLRAGPVALAANRFFMFDANSLIVKATGMLSDVAGCTDANGGVGQLVPCSLTGTFAVVQAEANFVTGQLLYSDANGCALVFTAAMLADANVSNRGCARALSSVPIFPWPTADSNSPVTATVLMLKGN